MGGLFILGSISSMECSVHRSHFGSVSVCRESTLSKALRKELRMKMRLSKAL